MAVNFFMTCQAPQASVAREQGAAGPLGQSQSEGVGQRQRRDGSAITGGLNDAGAVEIDDLEAHGQEAVAAEGLQLEVIQKVRDAELQAQRESRGKEGPAFEVDKNRRV